MSFVTYGAGRLHYSQSLGDQEQKHPPLVLLHGAGGNLYHWPSQIRRLPGYTVYAIDLPGHGQSDGPGHNTIEGYVAAVRDWTRALELPPFVAAGHSMGGAITLDLALHYPDLLCGLILVSTTPQLRVNPAILEGLRTDQVAMTAQLVDWLYGPRATPEQKRQYARHLKDLPLDTMLGDWRVCDRFDVGDRLGELQLPTLVIAGALDKMTRPRQMSAMASAIAGADLVRIEDGGHMVMVEQPALVAGAMRGFLDRLVGERAGGTGKGAKRNRTALPIVTAMIYSRQLAAS